MIEDVAKGIFVLGVTIFAFVRLPREVQARRMTKHKNVRAPVERLLIVIAALGLVYVPLLYAFINFPDRTNREVVPVLAWLGAFLFLAAQAVIYSAHRALGRNFFSRPIIRKDHKLVSDGIYAHVRHPIYSGFWLWAIGQALLLPNWIAGLSGLFGFGLLYVLRVGHEERQMIETFGEEYRAYMRRTPRLVPWPQLAHRDRP